VRRGFHRRLRQDYKPFAGRVKRKRAEKLVKKALPGLRIPFDISSEI